MSDFEIPRYPHRRPKRSQLPEVDGSLPEALDLRPSLKIIEDPPVWEYLVQELERDGTGQEINTLLQSHGRDGWEYCGVVRTVKVIEETTSLGIPTGRRTHVQLQSLAFKRIKGGI